MPAAVDPIPFSLPPVDLCAISVEIRLDGGKWQVGEGHLSADDRLVYYQPSASELFGARQLAVMLVTPSVSAVQTICLPYRSLT